MGRLLRRRRKSEGTAAPEVDLRSEQGVRTAYQAHGPELYRFALRQLGDEIAAQDAVQETFLRAWRAGDRFDPELASLRVWLFAIARNVLLDELRRAGRRPVPVPPEENDRSRTNLARGGVDEQVMRSWLVEEALQRIGQEHRVALVETYLRGRPYAEVAAEQNIPVGTLRSRLFYGLKALRVVMDEMGVRE
ncbi:sigma-70 family RNA polymerase sigma factor [Nocardiopsis sp. HNM0947]|uniref:Sigma-70 family RNA polymerase sigma factor n=1 Tax=Nocardiopsis coralli TaxID=2772213 RepID=A0ABR9PAH0_9ACTN|nr:sigma-70 family RNA polymerase sigma factor [Nocardiopsis coralli]MBE3000837.1 sigma-70 family RNA polymerase sigma factor [Nocardiopsis coralli]